MKYFYIMLILALGSLAHSFENLPKEYKVMKSMSGETAKMTLNAFDLKQSSLEVCSNFVKYQGQSELHFENASYHLKAVEAKPQKLCVDDQDFTKFDRLVLSYENNNPDFQNRLRLIIDQSQLPKIRIFAEPNFSHLGIIVK